MSYPNTTAPQLLLDLLNAFGRPPGLVIWLGLIAVLFVDHGSMPSGHVVGAAVFVVVLAAIARRGFTAYGLVAGVAFVAAMAWSRTWVNAHWITDTLTGAMLGAGTAFLLWWAFAPLLARDRERAQRRALTPSTTID